MITVRVSVCCTQCGNDTDIQFEFEVGELAAASMILPNTVIKAQGRVRECDLCKRALIGAR
jgi:hypothetical protein